MNRLGEQLDALAQRLEPGRWALVGGLAVSARVEPRFTRDIDLAVVVRDDTEAEALVMGLTGQGYCTLAVIEQRATGRLSTVRLLPPGEGSHGVVADLLFASSGIEHEIVAAAEPMEILPGLTVPVASVAHLIALKLLARDDRHRPQDRVDLVHLLAAARPEDLESVRAATAQILGRGYHRGRDLAADLEALLRALSDPG